VITSPSRKSIPWRLGVDLGTNSLGWCVFDLSKPDADGRRQPIAIRRIGVRIYSDGRDPQSGASLATERREPRSARRRRDRFLDRRATLMHALIRHGLMPAEPAARKALEALDPWRLRGEGLDRGLGLHELGRVIFHLNQRRGFKSNRRADRGKDEKSEKDTQDMKSAIRALGSVLDGVTAGRRTLGEYLYTTRRAEQAADGTWLPKTPAVADTVRSRPKVVKGRNAYDFYPGRAMVEAEFDALWAAQARHHPDLTDAARNEIRRIVFHQRPLKPVEAGPCTLDPEDTRAPLALPIVQEFRILQELANLELVHKRNPLQRRRLTLAERDVLLAELRTTEKLSFTAMRKRLRIEAIWAFNLESEKRDHLKGDVVGKRLADAKGFGPRWRGTLTDAQRQEVVQALLDEEDEDALVRRGVEEWTLTSEAADYVANIGLPAGYGSLGLKALSQIVPILRTEAGEDGGPIRYSEAVARTAYRHHSDFRDGEILDELPYYAEVLRRYVAPVRSESAPEWERAFGRIANPTVHIGLQQLRKLLNALIERYGHPEEIVVELARELKLSLEQKERIQKDQAENQKKNDLRREKLAEIGQDARGDRLLRMRLWEELNPADANDRKCVYTGEQISMRRLFSDEVEIEHILPFTRSLDDNPSNLTVSLRKANRHKGNETPYEAFHTNPTIDGKPVDWDALMLRVSSLPKAKQWRFRPDAIEIVQSRLKREAAKEGGGLSQEMLEDIERTGGFLARQLVDTAYLARVTRQYLWKVCHPDKTWVIPGQMTSLLRRRWGLNSLLSDHNLKNRADHRHHAIDAAAVGLTDRSMLQRIATAAANARERLIDDMPDPWEGFRDDLKRKVAAIVVSHRPDHSPKGRLHEETAYSLVKDPEREGGNVVTRKPIDGLSLNEVDRIRDPQWRAKLKAALGPLLGDEAALDAAKARMAEARKRKDARALELAKENVERIKREIKQAKKSGVRDFKAALAKFGEDNGIRRIRLVKPEAAVVIIKGRDGTPYKAYSLGDNHRVDVFARPDGSWGREIVSVYDANQDEFAPRWQAEDAANRLVFSLHKNDLVRLDAGGEDKVMRLVSIWEKYLQLAGHAETNLAERYRDGEFKWTFANYDKLRDMRVRKVTVDLLGRLRDPGPPR